MKKKVTDYFPHASRSVIQRNLEFGGDIDEAIAESDSDAEYSRQVAELERHFRDATLVAAKAQIQHTGRFLIRVTSCRRNLLDEDNLAEKYHVDCCRYSGLIPDDDPGKTKIEVSQEKVGSKDPEYTRIEIFAILTP